MAARTERAGFMWQFSLIVLPAFFPHLGVLLKAALWGIIECMKSLIFIHFSTFDKAYLCDVQGRFGGGYRNAFAGRTPILAAIFARREAARYGRNPYGCEILAPPEVVDAL